MAASHTEALRRLGVPVVGLSGRTHKSALEAAQRLGIENAFESVEALTADRRISVVHVTSPNDAHAEQAPCALQAGKHVVCEKPLGITSDETSRLVSAARAAGVVNAVSFNLRFYPQCQNAVDLVRRGAVGAPRFMTGGYHQDWLLLETDWNWRLDQSRQGRLRSVADIGSHWLDLAQYVGGQRLEAIMADLHTFVSERNHPRYSVKTFAASTVPDDVERVRESMISDDAAGILLRFENGMRGICSISQVSAGRKNRLHWELNGASASLAWDSEGPEELWVGHRASANHIMAKDPEVMAPLGVQAAAYPAGCLEGYPDTFRAMFESIYRDVIDGRPSEVPAYPTFEDGNEIALVCDAVLASAASGEWARVIRD
jgi:predicted dehydrogenase